MIRRLFSRKPSRTHYRSNGPVIIDPDRREIIHVRGTR